MSGYRSRLWLLSWLVTSFAASNAVAEPSLTPSSANAGPSVLMGNANADDREVYIITSKVNGTIPKLGPARHASIAICPQGVSPVVCENGTAVSNCAQCKVYGTQLMQRGFKLEAKRRGVHATKVRGMSAATVERRMRCHRRMSVLFLHDCRHDVIQVLGLRDHLGRRKLAFRLK